MYIEEGIENKKIKKSNRIGIKEGKEMLCILKFRNYFSVFLSS